MSTDEAIVLPLRVAVTDIDDHPPAIPFPGRDTKVVLLPKWVYIKNKPGHYLAYRPEPFFLTFREGDPDLNCAFEVVAIIGPPGRPGAFNLRGRYGNQIIRMGKDSDEWYVALILESVAAFDVITSTGNRVYLKDAYRPSRFMSGDLNSFGCPIARDYLNESSLLEILQAAVKNEITDVEYDIPGGKVREAVPLIALSTSVRNKSDGPVDQTLKYAYEKWLVGTWNNTAGIEIGAKATFTAGVPFVASAEFEISVSASYSHEWGGQEGKKETITSTTTVTVPPKKQARVNIIIRNAQIDIGFTYTQEILWSNGESEKSVKKGIYNNIDSWHVDVVVDNWEDIPP